MFRLRVAFVALCATAALAALAYATPYMLIPDSTYNPSLAQNPWWDPLHKSAGAEAEFASEARSMSIGTTVAKLFKTERNILYQTYRTVERKVESGEPDPKWPGKNAEAFIDLHEDDIPTDQLWRFNLTQNRAEAELLLADMQAQERDAALLAIKFGLTD